MHMSILNHTSLEFGVIEKWRQEKQGCAIEHAIYFRFAKSYAHIFQLHCQDKTTFLTHKLVDTIN